ncbi:MAG: hypothetical protein IT193_08330 [Propionibacteriaceae bacterium]|nr:hypothetical protein [Propionibacteriaceae bacterium]
MALICAASASGSPGVTSTLLGMALCWPRPVLLVEADPTAGSAILAGRVRGLQSHAGLIDLVMAQRGGVLAEALPRVLMDVPDTTVSILTGSRTHAQAAGLARIWEPLLGVLRGMTSTGADVLVDAGQLGLDGSPTPLIADADLTLLVLRSNLRALAAAKSWADTLGADAVPGHSVQAVVVGENRPYRAADVARTLGLSVLGTVAWDPRRAEVFADGADKPVPRLGGATAADRAFEASGYLRGIRALGEAARKAATGTGEGSLLREMIAARIGEEARR